MKRRLLFPALLLLLAACDGNALGSDAAPLLVSTDHGGYTLIPGGTETTEIGITITNRSSVALDISQCAYPQVELQRRDTWGWSMVAARGCWTLAPTPGERLRLAPNGTLTTDFPVTNLTGHFRLAVPYLRADGQVQGYSYSPSFTISWAQMPG